MITCHLFDGPTGDQILDLTPYVRACPVARGVHGDSDVALTLALPSLSQQLALIERYAVPWLEVHDATGVIWAGRLEDMQAASSGQPALTAYGPWRALDDVRVTALWSDTRTDAWRLLTEEEIASLRPAFYEFDTQERIFVGLQKNTTYQTAASFAFAVYTTPDRSSRDIQNIAFDVRIQLPVGWIARIDGRDASYGSTVIALTLNGTGATVRQSYCLPLSSARPLVGLLVFNNTGAPVTYAGENGQDYVALTNVRVTTQPLAVTTTLTAGALLGATSVTVASAANITVGQSLYLGGTNPERVTVTSVVGLTIGVTPLAAAKAIGDTARAQRVLASDIATAIAATVAALNPAQITAGAQLIQPSTVDRRDVLFQDQPATTLLEGLAAEEQLAVGVSRERLVYLRPRDQAAWAQTFAVDAASLTVGRTIEQLRNSIYGVYTDPDGRPLRTAAATNAQSVIRWGLTRQAALAVETTAVAQAAAFRDYALADSDDPAPQAAIAFTQLWTEDGAPAPLSALAPGDTLLIRNLPSSSAAGIDDLAVVRVARTVLDPTAEDRAAVLTVELENPPAELEVALARIALFYEPPAPQGFDKPLRIAG